MTRPLFRAFDQAWTWFNEGGELEPMEERRARFTQGRAQFLAFQAPIDDARVIEAIIAIRDSLSNVPNIEPMRDEHLHISIRGVGFQVLEKRKPDDIGRGEVARAGESAAKALRGTKPINVRVGPVNVFPDALILEVHDDGALGEVRRKLGEALQGDDAPIDDGHYLPHITLAMFGSADVVSVLRERLPALRETAQVAVTLRRIEYARWWFTGFDEREETELEIVRAYALR
jgi:2'-5' RNA ligase